MTVHEIRTTKKNALINVSAEVSEAVRRSGVTEGTVTVYCPHTTAGITINENADPDVCADLLKALEKLMPGVNYLHMEGNSDAHLKASLLGASVVIPVCESKPAVGMWQGIYFCEFDGPRSRKFYVTVNGK